MKYIALQWISGSGKTTLAKKLSASREWVFHIGLDWYFHEWQRIIDTKNKEDISALNLELLQSDIDKLNTSCLLTRRRYDFIQKKSIIIEESNINENSTVIVEWIHAFNVENIIWTYWQKVFIDIPEEIALLRRMKRDYSNTDPEQKIKPIWEYLEYLESYLIPSQNAIRESGKLFANHIITDLDNREYLDIVFSTR